MQQRAKIQYHTRNRGTRCKGTMGLPVPVQNPTCSSLCHDSPILQCLYMDWLLSKWHLLWIVCQAMIFSRSGNNMSDSLLHLVKSTPLTQFFFSRTTSVCAIIKISSWHVMLLWSSGLHDWTVLLTNHTKHREFNSRVTTYFSSGFRHKLQNIFVPETWINWF